MRTMKVLFCIVCIAMAVASILRIVYTGVYSSMECILGWVLVICITLDLLQEEA